MNKHKFISLCDFTTGNLVAIRSDYIFMIEIYDQNPKASKISLINGDSILVSETVNDILSSIVYD